jgi:hypothetical protein
MPRVFPLLTAILLVAATGVVHGLRTNRWSVSRELESAVARLDRVPTVIGDWEGKPSELDRRQLEAAGIAGHLVRRYVNRQNGEAVTLLIVCGRPGPIAVHTPDVCYSGIGFELREAVTKVTVEAGSPPRPAEFCRGDFVKQGPAPSPSGLRIFWAWDAAGPWAAPENPRLTYAPYRALYKLYVVRELADRPGSPAGSDKGVEFLRALLPELDRCLFPDRTAARS